MERFPGSKKMDIPLRLSQLEREIRSCRQMHDDLLADMADMEQGVEASRTVAQKEEDAALSLYEQGKLDPEFANIIAKAQTWQTGSIEDRDAQLLSLRSLQEELEQLIARLEEERDRLLINYRPPTVQ